MKKIVVVILAISFLGWNHPIKDKVVEWRIDTSYDFGLMNQHEPQTVKFHFKNVTDEPFVIDNVRVECGCTAPSYDLAPILPDSTSFIEIEYDAKKVGYFYKKVRVFFSTQRKPELLYIEGEVE